MADLPEQLGKLSLRDPEEVPIPPPRRTTRASIKKPTEDVPTPSGDVPIPPPRRTARASIKKPTEDVPIPPPRRTARASIKKPTAAPEKDPCTKLRFEGFLKRSSPVVEKPIAIFIVGPVASGKTTTIKKLLPESFKYDYYNLDDYHEYLLEKHLFIKTDKKTQKKIKNMVDTVTDILYQEELKLNPSIIKSDFIKTIKEEDLIKTYNSMFSKLLIIANKCIQQDIDNLLSSPFQEQKNIVIDTTGGSYDKIANQKDILQSKGYKPIMIALYSSLYTTKKRNDERYRTVPLGGVHHSWLNTITNIPLYETLFNTGYDKTDENEAEFYLINTDPIIKANKIDIRIKDKNIHFNFKNIQDVKTDIYNTILLRQGKRMSDTIPRTKINISRRKAVSL